MKNCFINACSRLPRLFALFAFAVQAAPAEQPGAKDQVEGWKYLFDGSSTQGWHGFKQPGFPSKGWKVEDGWLHCLGNGGGDLLSDALFDNFDLRWEWKIEPAGNSGMKYFVLEEGDSGIGHEYQMLDDSRNPDAKLAEGKRVTASLYDVLKPSAEAVTKPIGEINQSRILVQGNHVEHWLNGVKVLEYECGSPEIKAAIAKSKFKKHPGFADHLKAHILLQDHHSQVWFKGIKIRELPSK